jgi:geranylgeranylglycerol-phosphate geranylgeranyltransferase
VLAHVHTWRLYECGHPVLAAVAGAALAGQGLWSWPAIGVAVGCLLGWIGGMYAGDVLGWRQDLIAKPHRPIPSGAVSPRSAYVCVGVLAGSGCALLVVINWRALVFVGLTVACYAAYNLVLKDRGLPGDLVVGVATSLSVFLIGTTAGGGWPPARLLPVAGVLLLQGIYHNLLQTLTDVDGDRRAGWRTVPVRHGVDVAVHVLAFLGAGWLLLAAALPFWLGHGTAVYFGLLAGSVWLTAASLRLIPRGGRPLPREVALAAYELHLVDRAMLPAALLSLAADPLLVLVILGLAVVITRLSARALLHRHELGSLVG